MTPHLNRLSETVLLRGHNACFNAEIWKISLNYPFYPFLSGALAVGTIFHMGSKWWLIFGFVAELLAPI